MYNLVKIVFEVLVFAELADNSKNDIAEHITDAMLDNHLEVNCLAIAAVFVHAVVRVGACKVLIGLAMRIEVPIVVNA